MQETTPELLRFILYTYCPLKKLMRLIGFSTGNTNVVISTMLKNNLIKEKNVNGNTVLNITKDGIEHLRKYYPIDEDLVRRIHARAAGENKMRQVKLAASLQMLYPLIPDYLSQFTSFFQRLRSENTVGDVETITARSQKIENIRREMDLRQGTSSDGNYFLTTREMRELDNTRMRNLSTARAQGLLHAGDQNYIIYNSFKARMRAYGDAEGTYRDFIEEILGERPRRALFFGISNRIAMETVSTRKLPGRDFEYIINNRYYDEQYFVPMTYYGAKQMRVYGEADFQKRAANWLVYPQNKERAQGSIYDGITEDGDIVYIGFMCDLNKTIQIQQNINSIRSGSEVIVFCFPHQAEFYHQAFGSDGHIYVIDYDTVFQKTGIQTKREGA